MLHQERMQVRRSERGFTLLELLVTVALIGILSAMAISAFTSYRRRAYEAVSMGYIRCWVAGQELYLDSNNHYADADTQLQGLIRIRPPTNIPYTFTIESGATATDHWWGRATPTESGLHYLYIDDTGIMLSSLSGPPAGL